MTLLRRALVLAPLALLASGGTAAGLQQSVQLPPGFVDEVVVGGLDAPTDFAFLGDGRILFAEKEGIVRIFAQGRLRRRPFVDVRRRVNSRSERGLVTVAADPRFVRNGFVYLYYSVEVDPAHPARATSMRLTRLKAAGDVVKEGSETVILGAAVGDCNELRRGSDCIPANCVCHIGASIRFGRDGTLYLSTGDGARAGAANTDALRAQDVGSLAGKLLRITRTGQGLPDNPFWNGDPDSIRSKVWALGLRQPFRFTLRPRDGRPFVGDVGWRGWEEIDAVRKGGNLGWPCYEGRGRQPAYRERPACRRLYNQGPAAVDPPLYTYRRGRQAAVVGGEFNMGAVFPPRYADAYFFGDYARRWIKFLRHTGRGVTAQPFAELRDGPIAIAFGPDGALYYLTFEPGALHRIRARRG